MDIKKIIIALVLSGLIGGFGYYFYKAANLLGGGECGMLTGPVYGQMITVDEKQLDLEQKIALPNGSFGLLNLSDTLSPKLIKMDHNNQIVWAVEFKDEVGIPYEKLSNMSLDDDEYGIRLSFFNHSYGEPGAIYLTDDYELEYMCLNPM